MSGWGWNPSSFEAIGTVAAFAIGFFALAITIRQQQQARVDDQARHARLVSVQLRAPEPLPGSPYQRYTLEVTNGGLLPIHDLKPVIGGTSVRPSQFEGLFGAGKEPDVLDARGYVLGSWLSWGWRSWGMKDLGWGSVPPAEQKIVSMLLDVSLERWRREHIAVTFRDANGRYWIKHLDGTLRSGTLTFGPSRRRRP